ncbi:DUF3313 domain-containing protein [Desulfovibrio oxamicus]|uniref:DUF3313 domain-containing protein n=1 Tax=Nitratidesulfovibrio oxamicus TaxID=32016 RepID=A0ABS0J1U8_9BACT|nr:DUF3313 domain-containing protein [Nitratidesulfovibrio oxamicus]MBG3875956.1 DUF3313 domain-containing protein [Nitratidesulfovibrio oxamicus]
MTSISRITSCIALVLLLAVTGCAAHKMEAKPSGFLKDYGKLKKGRDDQAGLVWIKSGISARDYDAVVIDRPKAWIKPDAPFKGVDGKELDELLTFFGDALVREVGKSYRVVAEPGPRVLVLRTALTGLVPGEPVSGTLTSVVPIGIAVSGAARAVGGEHIGTGEAAVEMEMLDGATSAQLAAAVDRRSGTKAPLRGSMQDAKDACTYWAGVVGKRLAEFKTGNLRP